MKLISLLLAAALTFSPAFAVPATSGEQVVAIEQGITLAGRLRLQSQRLAKLWLQAGLGIQRDVAAVQIARAGTQFEGALADLRGYGSKPAIQRDYRRVQELWQEYRNALALPFSDANLKVVSYLADDLMLATGRLAMKIEGEAENGSSRLLDLSLRQNMLAQRLAKLYLQAQAGDRSYSRLVDIDQARKEFATALRELGAAQETTPASREALELANVQWVFFDQAISGLQKGGDSKPQHVATTSERIMEVLDAVSLQIAADARNARLLASQGSAVRRN